MSDPGNSSRGARAPRPLVVVAAAVLGIGALGGATGAILGGVSLAAAEVEQAEHSAGRDGADAFDQAHGAPRGEDERSEPTPAPAPVAPAPAGSVPPGR